MGEVGRVQKWIRSGTTESYQNEYRLSEWVHYWVSIESHHDGLLINIAPRVSESPTLISHYLPLREASRKSSSNEWRENGTGPSLPTNPNSPTELVILSGNGFASTAYRAEELTLERIEH